MEIKKILMKRDNLTSAQAEREIKKSNERQSYRLTRSKSDERPNTGRDRRHRSYDKDDGRTPKHTQTNKTHFVL